MAFALLVMTLGGIAGATIGWFSLTGKLPPNRWAGIRTPYTMSSSERWYAAHRAGAPWLIFGGVATAMTGLAFTPFALAGKVPAGLALAVLLGCAAILLVSAIGSWQFGVGRAKSSLGENTLQ